MSEGCGAFARLTRHKPLKYYRIPAVLFLLSAQNHSHHLIEISGFMAYGHLTSGGMLDKIDSTLPPVLRPNIVPLS